MTTKCEQTEYGRFRQGSNHGRCSTGDYQQYLNEFGAACCDYYEGTGDFTYCPNNLALVTRGQPMTLEVPTYQGQPICDDSCRATAEQWYAECNPRIAAAGAAVQTAVENFIAQCQGITPLSGGGH